MEVTLAIFSDALTMKKTVKLVYKQALECFCNRYMYLRYRIASMRYFRIGLVKTVVAVNHAQFN